jgi:hypothetical protein
MKGWKSALAAAALAVATAAPARAGTWDSAGWGLLTVLANFVYMPGKIVYATVGSLTGGLAWVCTGGNVDPANTIWTNAVDGTYVLTPRMLQGEDDIAFIGGSEVAPTTTASVPPPPHASSPPPPPPPPLEEKDLGPP